MDRPVRVFLVHRYRLLTDALRTALARDQRVVLVGQTPDVDDAVARLDDVDADVVLIDAELDQLPSRPTIRQLKGAHPDLRIVPIGLETHQQVVECIEAGASGYLPLEASLTDLVRTIKLIGSGQAHCPPDVAVSIFARIAELARYGAKRRRSGVDNVYLTPRESEVLRHIGSGKRNKEIARELGIAVPTVKNHVHKILEKLDVKRRREAVRAAYEIGLLDDNTGLPGP